MAKELSRSKPEQKLLPHHLELIDRKTLHITGILEVLNATESIINTKSSLGKLQITGSSLKIKNLSRETNEVDIEGEINEIKYNNTNKKIFQKLFK